MIEATMERQLEREEAQIHSGVLRYVKQQASKDEGDTDPGKTLMKNVVEPVADAIKEMIEMVESGGAGAGRPAIAVRYLVQLIPEAVAYLTGRAMITAAVRSDKVPRTAMALSQSIEECFRFDELRIAEIALAISAEKKARKWTTSHHRRAIMRHASDVASVRGLEWSRGDKLRLGMKLIELFIETTGLMEMYLDPTGTNRTNYRLRPTPALADWLAHMHERCALLEPRFMPMICPPKPWTSPVSGGYYSSENKQDFLRGTSPELRDDMLSMDLTEVFDAVNRVQATRWSINRSVFDVFKELWDSGSTLANLPSQEPELVPPRPSSFARDLRVADMNPEQKEEFDEWRSRAARAHDRNAELIGKRIATAAKLSMSFEVRDEEVFYFPHNVDFRGRLYSIVPDLQPQADDLGKALLQFADGKPLGDSGAYWLHVHIANLFGVDKVSYDDRVEWVREHSAEILDSAADPLDGKRFWCDADAPWGALAACFEYAGYMVAGDDFESHLPVAMDGSCSGLQHFSAMLKDKDGARAVNLLPSDKPADIYTEVQEEAERALLKEEGLLAQAWRSKITRKIVKRPCMTFAYSVTSRGIRDQILEELRKESSSGEYLPGFDNWHAATMIAPIVEQAIRSTVKRAAEAMDWLKKSVKLLIACDRPVTWATPLGFPVQQRYFKTNGKRYFVWFQGVRMRIQLRSDTKTPDGRKQQSAVAPNFVHSMDAAHLQRVVNRMVEEGVTTDFAVIHDSFGVHACDVDELQFVIRDEFIRLYSEDQLGIYRDYVVQCLPEDHKGDVLPTPEAGELNLEEVRNADFFFS